MAASLQANPPTATHVTVAWSVCLYVCRLSHHAKAVGQNEMPFDRDTRVVPSNTVLDRDPDPLLQEGEVWGQKPAVCNDVAYCLLKGACFYSSRATFRNVAKRST